MKFHLHLSTPQDAIDYITYFRHKGNTTDVKEFFNCLHLKKRQREEKAAGKF